MSSVPLSPQLKALIDKAKSLYLEQFSAGDSSETKDVRVAVAPGRVNLIGEHTDYTGGFVLPFAIDYVTVVYGTGSLERLEDGVPSSASVRLMSTNSPGNLEEIAINLESVPPQQKLWTTYVAGTIFQYLPDLPKATKLNLCFVISGNVPLGSGLSSSASLEVSVARFVESILGDEHAFSSVDVSASAPLNPKKTRAIRCQKAENDWCGSPCGIMDQYVSSAASAGALLLIDCTSLEYKETKMAETDPMPVLVVTNSNVQHDIAGGEYPVRVAQCKVALAALAKLNEKINSLRGATLHDVEQAKDLMADEVSYLRAKHVVTENERTLQAKEALEKGEWTRVGELMNGSHASMRDDYEVSCEEIDLLVDMAQRYKGVYGSRLTGGGFGGCTVTLVEKEHAEGLMSHLSEQYKAKTGKDCSCFMTSPGKGAHLVENYA
jgi:galactokinase